MSSDNYYTVRQSEVDGLWYVRHGFMSDGPTAVLRQASEGFATRAEAVEFYLDQDHSFLGDYYSEYGLVP